MNKIVFFIVLLCQPYTGFAIEPESYLRYWSEHGFVFSGSNIYSKNGFAIDMPVISQEGSSIYIFVHAEDELRDVNPVTAWKANVVISDVFDDEIFSDTVKLYNGALTGYFSMNPVHKAFDELSGVIPKRSYSTKYLDVQVIRRFPLDPIYFELQKIINTKKLEKKEEEKRIEEMMREVENEQEIIAEKLPVASPQKLAQLKATIRQQIERVWNRPISSPDGRSCKVRVVLVPGGNVGSVEVVTSSGNHAFDLSVVQAVNRAAPFPVPKSATLRRALKELEMTFVK